MRMSAEVKKEIQLEIAHVLFIDIVGYSKLVINEQRALLDTLNRTARGTEQFQTAEQASRLIKIPTGDGMALVFYNSPEAPVECALEISRAIKEHPELKLRMGVHSGPVNGVIDVTGHANLAGAGLNVAQRVMDCGDAGHILLSRHVAEDLDQYAHWRPLLHDLGECEVKHGDRVHVVNLYTEELGNPEMPGPFKQAEGAREAAATPVSKPVERLTAGRWAMMIGAVLLITAAVMSGVAIFLAKHAPTKAITSTATPEKSIAVLPFANLSEDKANEYFAEGIQEEILERLSKIADLKVISRTSTEKYKSAPANLREIAQQLGVANILEGTVQKAADQVRVNVQLINAQNDSHLWADKYDRKLADIFAVESEVAAAIAAQLNAKLTGAEQKAIGDKPTRNAAAYDAYLRALSITRGHYTYNAYQEAAAQYATAVQLDPKFALAWARLGSVRSYLYFNGVDAKTNSPEAVKLAADTAIALQPDLAAAWIAQGAYRYRVLRDFPGALRAYDEGRKRAPNDAGVYQHMAFVERRLGRWTQAEEHYKKAADLDPQSLSLFVSYGGECLRYLRRFDDAHAALDHALQISTNDESALANQAALYQVEGRLPEAAAMLARIPAESTDDSVVVVRTLQSCYERHFDEAVAVIQRKLAIINPQEATSTPNKELLTQLGYCYEWAGKPNESRAAFERALRAMKPSADTRVAPESSGLPQFLALTYAGLGDKDKALAQAKEAVADYGDDAVNKPPAESALAQIQARFGDSDSAIAAIPHLLEVPAGITVADLKFNPLWDPLRKDPRFQKLCQDKQP